MSHGPSRPTHRSPAHDPIRVGSRWGRVLLVGAVCTAVVIPASTALAAERSDHGQKPRPAAGAVKPGRGALKKPLPPVVHPTTAPSPAASPSASFDTSTGGQATGEPPKRDGEDLRWWPWGPVVSGRLTRPVQGGFSTLVLQRGEITAIGAGTVTVSSADGTSTVWTVTADTRVLGLPRTRPHAREGSTPTDSPSPSASPSASPAADPTAGLAVHQQVGVWGPATGDGVRATFLVVHGSPAPPASPKPTDTPTSSPSAE